MRPARLAKIRVGQQGDARFVAELAGVLRSFDGNVRELLGGRHLVDPRIRDKQRTIRCDNERNTHQALIRQRIDHAADFIEGDAKDPCDAGDHGVGIAVRDHARAEDIAVLIH